jgi:hypothetical protein
MKLGLSIVILSLVACAHGPTAGQVGAIAEASCILLAAFAGGPEEQALCATADDLIALETDIRGTRVATAMDASPGHALGRKLESCSIVPGTTICATQTELASAIKNRKAKKS